MTKTVALLELAERVENATGPDAELDALIRCALFAKPDAVVRQSPLNGAWCIYERDYSGKERLWEPRGVSRDARAAAYTASLDAAMQLVPPGLTWEVSTDYVPVHAGIYNGSDDDEGLPAWDASAASPALALCAASLRALASQGNNNA